MNQGWIGVDLDGTLAHYDKWMGPEHIGPPIPAMCKRVRQWLAEGRDVRIFTARVWPYTGVLQPGEAMPVQEGARWLAAFQSACAIAEFCRKHFDRVLPITCVKDMRMIELWDDRAVQVQPNTGRPIRDLVE